MKPGVLEARRSRLNEANTLIMVIAARGRHFFRKLDGATSRFELDNRGRLWWVDRCGGRIWTHQQSWYGSYRFTEGGSLGFLMEQLGGYIMTGRPVNPGHFGPWPEWNNAGDPWGYGADMEVVRTAARNLGVCSPAYEPAHRLMSFSMTVGAVERGQKTVTRRLGWWDAHRNRPRLKPFEVLWAVRKAQGLKKGEKVQRIREIEHVGSRREHLDALLPGRPYSYSRADAWLECVREGFPELSPAQFVDMFCKANRCAPDVMLTRIEFTYPVRRRGAS